MHTCMYTQTCYSNLKHFSCTYVLYKPLDEQSKSVHAQMYRCKHMRSTCIHEHAYMCFLLCPTVALFDQKLQYCQVPIPHCTMSSTNTLLQREADSYRLCFKSSGYHIYTYCTRVSTGCEVYAHKDTVSMMHMCWGMNYAHHYADKLHQYI